MVQAGVRAAMTWRACRPGVFAIRAAALIAMWAIWELTAQTGAFYERVVPSSFAILAALVKLVSQPAFYLHFAVSVGEILASLAIAAVFGGVLGIAIGYSRLLSHALEPILYYLAPTPKIVFFPILLIAFGVDAGSKIAVGALSAFFPIVMSTVNGMREVNPVHLDVGRSFHLNLLQMILRIYLPSVRAALITGLRLGLGLAVIGVLLAETKLSKQGLGFLAIQYYNTFRVVDLYAVLIVIFVFTALLNGLLERFEGSRGAP
jgi:ABC-type nitrate/sulfonate/bicarbonate transport system permease component